jgi:hypothetical protein
MDVVIALNARDCEDAHFMWEEMTGWWCWLAFQFRLYTHNMSHMAIEDDARHLEVVPASSHR